MQKILIGLIFAFAWFLIQCSGDKFSTDLEPEELSAEDSLWLADDDNDGFADSIQKYAEDCELLIEDCLNLARNEQERILNFLTLVEPALNLESGTYSNVIYIEFEGQENTVIRYTLDGTDPDENSLTYTGPIKLEATATIKAVSTRPDFITSAVVSAEYVIEQLDKLDAPEFSVQGGTYTNSFMLALTSQGDNIFYTLDGSVPTPLSTLYEDSLTIDKQTFVQAIATGEGHLQSNAATAAYLIKADLPEANIKGGTYDSILTIELTSGLKNAIIHYTLDNSTPNRESPIYVDGITIDVTSTLKARILAPGWDAGEILEETYIIEIVGVSTGALFNPAGGSYTSAQKVSITSTTTGADIHYTLDGSEPTDSSTLYSAPLDLDSNTVIKAIVSRTDLSTSPVSTASYEFIPPAPVISPVSGSYVKEVKVTIQSDDVPSGQIHYTLDGMTPDSASEIYSDSVVLTSSKTIKAIVIVPGWNMGEVDSATYEITIPGQASAPVLTPAGGEFFTGIEVSVQSATPGAFFHYTTDGTDPDKNSTLYTGPISLSSSQMIKVISTHHTLSTSEITSGDFVIYPVDLVLPSPQMSPAGGTFDTAQAVTLSTPTEGTTIYYTLDGSEPDTNSMIYTSPIAIAVSTIIRAYATKEGSLPSPVAVSVFTINLAPVARPVITPAEGIFDDTILVTITTATPDADIYYTTDGSTPTENSTLYTAAFGLLASSQVMAVAIKEGMNNSTLTSAMYVINNIANNVDFSLLPGQVNSGELLYLTTEAPGGIIRYTTDGSMPDTGSNVFLLPISITSSITVRAGVWIGDSLAGEIKSASYTIYQTGSLNYTAPEGVSLTGGEDNTVTWYSSGFVGTVSIDYKYNGSPWIKAGISLQENSFDWKVPTINTSDMVIRIQNHDGSLVDTSSGFITVTTTGLPADTLIDFRDGKKYPIVMLDGKNWMAANLNYDLPPGVGSYQCLSWDVNCDYLGKFYDFRFIVDDYIDGICPAGWHLPTLQEFESMIAYAGTTWPEKDNPFYPLAAARVWSEDISGTNESGFNVIPTDTIPLSDAMARFYTSSPLPADNDEVDINIITFATGSVAEARGENILGEIMATRCVEGTRPLDTTNAVSSIYVEAGDGGKTVNGDHSDYNFSVIPDESRTFRIRINTALTSTRIILEGREIESRTFTEYINLPQEALILRGQVISEDGNHIREFTITVQENLG